MLSRFYGHILWSPSYWFHMCFPHINITWARRTGILTTAQVYLVTCFHIFTLHFFVLSVWDDDVTRNRFTSGPSALVLPFLSSEVRTCSAEKQSERERKMFFGIASILWMHGSRRNLSSSTEGLLEPFISHKCTWLWRFSATLSLMVSKGLHNWWRASSTCKSPAVVRAEWEKSRAVFGVCFTGGFVRYTADEGSHRSSEGLALS